MNTLFRRASLWLLVSLAFGCASTRPVDWDSRIGTYTFQQAQAELGAPTQVLRFNDATFLAEWSREESVTPVASASPGGYGSRRHWMDRQGMEALSQSSIQYLHLTFSAEDRLLKWDQGRK